MNLTSYITEYISSYQATSNPESIELKPTKYIVVDNIVRAESNEAEKAIKTLYILNEKIKLKSDTLKDYYDYDIYPLEGTWRLIKKEIGFSEHPKNLIGKFMIKQPLYITEDFFNLIKEEAIESTEDDEVNIYLASSKLETIDEGKSVQILHTGPYKDEPKSFKKIEDFLTKNNLIRKSLYHREIYLKDIRSEEPENYQTILRCEVK